MLGDTYIKFETLDGALVITSFPFEIGLCRLEAEVQGGAPQPGTPGSTKQQIRQQKKLARQQKRAARKAARQQQRASKRANKRRLESGEHDGHEHGHGEEGIGIGLGEHAHGHGHNHDHFHHAHDHVAMHRELQLGRLLVFIDTNPPDGTYGLWNSGLPVDVTPCGPAVTVDALPSILAAVREDLSPFNIEVRVLHRLGD